MAPLSNIDVPSGPCIPGHLRLFVNAFGNFYPCERVSETSPVMVIGNIEEGLNLDKAKHILDVGGITSEECMKCWAFRHCDLCAKKADDGSEQLSRSRKLKFCNETRAKAYTKLKHYLLFKEMPTYYPQQTRYSEREEQS